MVGRARVRILEDDVKALLAAGVDVVLKTRAIDEVEALIIPLVAAMNAGHSCGVVVRFGLGWRKR